MEKMPVTVVLDNVRSAQNVGAFFRTGDAFAVERIVLCGITATPPSRDIHKTALGAEMTVPWSYCASTVGCIAQLRAEGYAVYAVEQVEGLQGQPGASFLHPTAILFNGGVLKARQIEQRILEVVNGWLSAEGAPPARLLRDAVLRVAERVTPFKRAIAAQLAGGR
mgnify:CR=1 FL=1